MTLLDRPVSYLDRARASRDGGDVPACMFNSALAFASCLDPDAETEYHGYAGLGRMYASRAEWDKAVGWYEMALETALRRRLEAWTGPAYHDLYLMALETEAPEAGKLAGKAFEAYGSRHPRIPCFLFDVARAKRDWAHALGHCLTMQDGGLVCPRDGLYASANLVSGYARTGQRHKAVALWERVKGEGRTGAGREGLALAWAEVSEALMDGGLPEQAYEAATLARNVALARNEPRALEVALAAYDRATIIQW